MAVLVRESNVQLLMYLLDICICQSILLWIFRSQKGSVKALNFLLIASQITSQIISQITLSLPNNCQKVNCYWGCNHGTYSMSYSIYITYMYVWPGFHTGLFCQDQGRRNQSGWSGQNQTTFSKLSWVMVVNFIDRMVKVVIKAS